MKIKNLLYTAFLLIVLSATHQTSHAQRVVSEAELPEYKAKVKDIVTFLQYVLNTLGDNATSTRDKDVIINQSYIKIFRDGKVQVEDDLDENRDVITNKDVQAYLKDVDFFFKRVKFDFNIEDISHYYTDNGELFFRVSLTRNLKGIAINGDSVNNTRKRFVEVNLNPEKQDLKIVSIYTNEFSRKEVLKSWWNDLSYEWKAIFKRKVGLYDSVTASDIQVMAKIEELDISNNYYITNIEPLSQLSDLKRLDISGTPIKDLKPIRNLTRLEDLNISGTKVTDLEPLKYAGALRFLNLHNTPIRDISTVSRLGNLQSLNISHTNVSDIEPAAALSVLKTLKMAAIPIYNLDVLGSFKTLEELNLSSTGLTSFSPLGNIKSLRILRADSVPASDLTPLNTLEDLKLLSVNYTAVSDLTPLSPLTKLERVYCDATLVSKEDAGKFMAKNSGVLVIFESENLKTWWSALPVRWKEIFAKHVEINMDKPTKEELAKITSMDSINLVGDKEIESLDPLHMLRKLVKINASNSAIYKVEALSSLSNLEHLELTGTEVSDFSSVADLENLRIFKANNTNIKDLASLTGLTRLRELEIDKTLVNEVEVKEFVSAHPEVLIIYKSEYLKAWWGDLDMEWKRIFSNQTVLAVEPTRQQLHTLIHLEVVQFSDAPVNDLMPLKNFIKIKELRFSGTAVSDLSPITEFKALEILEASKSPIFSLAPIAKFKNLKVLNISNTPIDNLAPIGRLEKLKELNCAGTQIKKLNALDNLATLKVLDCSNTRVKKINIIEHLDLNVLKCFNTRISKRSVEYFKYSNPECHIIYY